MPNMTLKYLTYLHKIWVIKFIWSLKIIFQYCELHLTTIPIYIKAWTPFYMVWKYFKSIFSENRKFDWRLRVKFFLKYWKVLKAILCLMYLLKMLMPFFYGLESDLKSYMCFWNLIFTSIWFLIFCSQLSLCIV